VTRVADQADRLRLLAGARADGHGGAGAGAGGGVAPLVAIASGKGGVGKTTLAIAISIGLARAGLRTALLDADLGLANADLACGLSPTCRLSEAIGRVARGERVTPEVVRRMGMQAPGGFVLVPGVVGPPAGATPTDAREAVDQILGLLARAMQAVVVDHGAGIGWSVRRGLAQAAVPIIVTTPEPAAIADAYALLKAVHTAGAARTPWLLVNRARHAEEAHAAHARIAQVAGRFLAAPIPLLGWVPEDDAVARATRARRPLPCAAPRSRAWSAIGEVASRVCSELGGDDAHTRRPSLLARLLRGGG